MLSTTSRDDLGNHVIVTKRRVGSSLFAALEVPNVRRALISVVAQGRETADVTTAFRTISTCGAIIVSAMNKQYSSSPIIVPESPASAASVRCGDADSLRLMLPTMTWPLGVCSRQSSLLFAELLQDAFRRELSPIALAEAVRRLARLLSKRVRDAV